ncbi:HEAT repeat domain-containing protein [Fibrobacterota bacterium]
MADEIISLLNSGDPVRQIQGINRAQQKESFFHILQILKLLSSENKSVSEAAFSCILYLAHQCLLPGNQHALPEAVINTAVKIIQKLDQKYIRRMEQLLRTGKTEKIIEALIVMKFFIPQKRAKELLQRFLKHPDKKIRATAVMHMGGLALQVSADDLIGYLEDSDNRVKANAIEVLEELDSQKFINILNRFRADENNRVRANSLKALFSLGERNIKDDFKFMLMDTNDLMRASAVWALGEIGKKDPSFLKLLEVVKDDKEQIVIRNLVLASRKVGDVPDLAFLKVAVPETQQREPAPKTGRGTFLNIQQDCRDNYIELKLEGAVNDKTFPSLKQALDEAAEKSPKLVLDASEVEYIDNTGVELLHETHTRLKEKEGFLYLHECSYYVTELVQLSDKKLEMNIFHSREDIDGFLGIAKD